MIVAGHTDLQGLCLALSDWSMELKLIQQGVPQTRKGAG